MFIRSIVVSKCAEKQITAKKKNMSALLAVEKFVSGVCQRASDRHSPLGGFVPRGVPLCSLHSFIIIIIYEYYMLIAL